MPFNVPFPQPAYQIGTYQGYPVLARGLATRPFFAEKPPSETSEISQTTIVNGQWLNTLTVPHHEGIKLMKTFFHDKVWPRFPNDAGLAEPEAFTFYVTHVLPKHVKWDAGYWLAILD